MVASSGLYLVKRHLRENARHSFQFDRVLEEIVPVVVDATIAHTHKLGEKDPCEDTPIRNTLPQST